MDVHCSQSVADRAAAICKLHEMADYFLLGEGTWPADEEGLPAVLRTVRELGLNEAVAGQPGMTESTALGKELKLDLIWHLLGPVRYGRFLTFSGTTDISRTENGRSFGRVLQSRLNGSSVGWCFDHIMSFVIALSEQTKCVLGRMAEPPQFFHFFWNFFGPRKVVHTDDFNFAFGFTALRNGSKLPNQHQRNLLIVECETL
jgi:hypothetical protein